MNPEFDPEAPYDEKGHDKVMEDLNQQGLIKGKYWYLEDYYNGDVGEEVEKKAEPTRVQPVRDVLRPETYRIKEEIGMESDDSEFDPNQPEIGGKTFNYTNRFQQQAQLGAGGNSPGGLNIANGSADEDEESDSWKKIESGIKIAPVRKTRSNENLMNDRMEDVEIQRKPYKKRGRGRGQRGRRRVSRRLSGKKPKFGGGLFGDCQQKSSSGSIFVNS